MGRIILGVAIGFIAWSIFWVGGEFVLGMISPGWLGAYSADAQKALVDGTNIQHDFGVSLITLVRSLFTSLAAGFMAALVANESKRTPLILSVILIVFGAAVEIYSWRAFPSWYHIIFLIALLPMPILGAKFWRLWSVSKAPSVGVREGV